MYNLLNVIVILLAFGIPITEKAAICNEPGNEVFYCACWSTWSSSWSDPGGDKTRTVLQRFRFLVFEDRRNWWHRLRLEESETGGLSLTKRDTEQWWRLFFRKLVISHPWISGAGCLTLRYCSNLKNLLC